MDSFKETELLRMTKNELIDHILYLYKIHDCHREELSQWYSASEQIQNLRKKHWGEE